MSSGHKGSLPVFQKNAAFCLLLSASSKTQVHKHSSKFEEFTDSTFLLPRSINWFVKSLALTSPFLTLLSRSPFMTHRARRCVSSQSKPKLFISQKYKIQIYFHIFSAPSVPGAPDFCRQFIANNQCWQGTTSMIKDYTTVQIWADEDRPPLPLKPFSVSSSFHFYTFLQSPPNPLSPTPFVPFAVSIWDLQTAVCQQQSSMETGAPRVATGKGHQWVKNVNFQPSSIQRRRETRMEISPVTQHQQRGTTEDREDREAVKKRGSEVDTTFKKLD